MFGWFKKKEKRGTGEDWFRPQDRTIYKFFDGESVRKVDPKPIHTKLLAKRNEISADYKTAVFEIPNEFTEKAEISFYKTVRELFNLPPLGPDYRVEYQVDGKTVKTLSDAECLAVLDDFILFVETVKKNIPQSPTSSNPSALPPSPAEGSGDTKNGSASGSTGNGRSTSEREPSLTGRR